MSEEFTLTPEQVIERLGDLLDVDLRHVGSAHVRVDVGDDRELKAMTEGNQQAAATCIRHAVDKYDRGVTQAEILEVGEDLGIVGNDASQFTRATIRKRIGTLYSHMLVDREPTDRDRASYVYMLTLAGQQELDRLGEYRAENYEPEMNQKHEVMEAIDEHGRLSTIEMAGNTSLNRDQVQKAISELVKANAVVRTGNRYVITEGNGQAILKLWRDRFSDGYTQLPNNAWNRFIENDEAYKSYEGR